MGALETKKCYVFSELDVEGYENGAAKDLGHGAELQTALPSRQAPVLQLQS